MSDGGFGDFGFCHVICVQLKSFDKLPAGLLQLFVELLQNLRPGVLVLRS
jgi:hypothetical protein